MRIEELIIDGFKSYSVRTVVPGFDAAFNAITGLNGSGKSNILDAICFVLGITNMATVRAQNLQDLIYKRGQAGVTKATVTIVFDNTGPGGPIGFEEYKQITVTRQIMMGGTTKYLINGHRAQQNVVQNLFQSVQLNINNPNFLIMQGKITKVLNMRPAEVLSLIEEAAGTRMFEERKDRAIRTMARKDAKLDEINTLLKEEIEPKLDKLRAEKTAYLEFQQVQKDMERLVRLVTAHDYVRLMQSYTSALSGHEANCSRMKSLEDAKEQLTREMEMVQQQLEEQQAARDREMRKGGRFSALEEQSRTHHNELVRINTTIELKSGNVAEEEANLAALRSKILQNQRQLNEKKRDFEGANKAFHSYSQAHEAKKSQLTEKEELLETLSTGIAARAGEGNGYQDKLNDAQKQHRAAMNEENMAQMQIKHLQQRIKQEQPNVAKAMKANQALVTELEHLREQHNSLQRDLEGLQYDDAEHKSLISRRTELQQKLRALTQQLDNLRRSRPGLDFVYSDPSPNFDRNTVKGLVAQLFSIKPENEKKATALEVAAGGRLYNVVVDSEMVGSQLLSRGQLRKRVTIIPLNKIAASRASRDRVEAAKKLAPGQVELAIDLVGYQREITTAMEYVFGSTLICTTADVSKQVTFDRAVRLKSVTEEGDIYDPAGTLSGGASSQSSSVLLHIQEMQAVTERINAVKTELEQVQNQIKASEDLIHKTNALRQQLDLKSHELQLAQGRIEANHETRVIREVEEAKAKVNELQTSISEFHGKAVEAEQLAKSIEKDMKEFNSDKGKKLRELSAVVEALVREVEEQAGRVASEQSSIEAAQFEIEQLGADISQAEGQCAEAEASCASLRQQIVELEQAKSDMEMEISRIDAELADERRQLSAFNAEIESLEQAKKAKALASKNTALEIQELQHSVEHGAKNVEQIQATLKQLVAEHEWIEEHKEQFGARGTVFDFNGQNIAQCRASLKSLSGRFDSMKRKINEKVMNMIDGVERKERDLKTMVRKIHQDRHKIEETIASLDDYKREALENTWRKVDVDFGNIFGELLPGNTAKLVPPEGQTVTQGLEVKVCLGQVWKDSLTELSGGQRSLIALSLIMSLLQFKPAPMYILDEVDAALDLSHTQNIGRLIKTRFRGSQFIVVSLKEGMFTNANKIFRTRFLDGTSVVQQIK